MFHFRRIFMFSNVFIALDDWIGSKSVLVRLFSCGDIGDRGTDTQMGRTAPIGLVTFALELLF